MRHVFSVLCFTCVCAVNTVTAHQNTPSEGKQQYVVAPSDQALLAIAYQPDCPLQFEEAKLLVDMNGRGARSFQLRNRGVKPIRAYTVATSSGYEWTWEAIDPSHFLKPGQKEPDSESSKNEIVPLTDTLLDKLNLRGRMKAVEILMVVRVEHVDGSVYDNEKALKALKVYFEGVTARK